MNITKSCGNLSSNQKLVLHRIMHIIEQKMVLSQKEVGLLGYEIESCPQYFILESFGVVRQTIKSWKENGFPVNPDGTYPLTKCIEWRVEREKRKYQEDVKDPRAAEELKRLENQNRISQLKIADLENKTISKEEHLEVCHRLASIVKKYYSDMWKLNHLEIMKNIDCRCTPQKYIEVTGFYFTQITNLLAKAFNLKNKDG